MFLVGVDLNAGGRLCKGPRDLTRGARDVRWQNAVRPVEVLAEPEPHGPTANVPAPSSAATIEIELNGARVRVIGMVDPLQLRLVMRYLMPA